VPAQELVFRDMKQRAAPKNLHQSVLEGACAASRRSDMKSSAPTQTGDARAWHDAFHAERKNPPSFLKLTLALPRYRIFYNAKYEKALGLPMRHALVRQVR
jgi:hypothetical protein